MGALVCTIMLITASCVGARPVIPIRHPAGPVVILEERHGGEQEYLGNEACRECHPGVYAFWRRTVHARSFQDLSRAGERKDPTCLRCHTTGYGELSGFLDPDRTPGLAAVGCEACHGPGALHAGSLYPELVPTTLGRDCPPCEIQRLCHTCHTQIWSPDFQLGRDLGPVSCKTARSGD